jgi:hypothetical protein
MTSAGWLRHGTRMSSLVHKGGWAKCEAEAVRGADEDTDGSVSSARGTGVRAARGAGVDTGVARGAVVDVRSARDSGWGAWAASGASWGAGAACGMATISEVPTTEEG